MKQQLLTFPKSATITLMNLAFMLTVLFAPAANVSQPAMSNNEIAGMSDSGSSGIAGWCEEMNLCNYIGDK